VTGDIQLYVITGRIYFWYVRFKVDRAHPQLLPARHLRAFVGLETREAILSTWFFQFTLVVEGHSKVLEFT